MKKTKRYELIRYETLAVNKLLQMYKKPNNRKFAFKKFLQNRILKRMKKIQNRLNSETS